MAINTILPDFQEFLRSRKLVPEKNIPYYAYWAGKFIHFSNKDATSDKNKLVHEFMDSLQRETNVQDRQIYQADEAVQLYLVNYQGKVASDSELLTTETREKESDIPQIMKEMRRIMRLKHYSYSTERTYLDWATRFFRYVQTTKGNSASYVTDDIKQYLSHLAVLDSYKHMRP
jgi:hypothetical protein